MKFSAELEIIGINPFVRVPDAILQQLMQRAGKLRGPIPVRGTINKKQFTQTLVRYKGLYRLYVNTTMLKNSPQHVGEKFSFTLDFDPAERTFPMHDKLLSALKKKPVALHKFRSLTPYRQQEINRYINRLKTEESRNRNILKVVAHLLGKERFAGRDPDQ